MKDKFNLIAIGWQFYHRIIFRMNWSYVSDQFKRRNKILEKNNKLINEITELVTKVKSELTNGINNEKISPLLFFVLKDLVIKL